MNETIKNLFVWLTVGFLFLSLLNNFGPKYANQVIEVPYSEFVHKASDGQVKSITLRHGSQMVKARTINGEQIITTIPAPISQSWLDNLVKEHNVLVRAMPAEQGNILLTLLIHWGPILLFIGIWVFFMRQLQGGLGGKGAMSFGRSKAKLMGEEQVKVTFKDVAGVDEAKQEVGEVVDFLRMPAKFHSLGGKIPRGILMVGPPGTGKTLLAKAIAGEAKVPFYTISGSDFVEMFVGVGASRVRDMFEQSKKNAPCIIFIDEIDAVGRHRGAGLGGGHDEREQTLNQLLVEMDGFSDNDGVIVVAATNRPDVLDPALLRPGRFDRRVTVSLPDVRGREQILKVHLRKVPEAEEVEAKVIARGTPGLSGADLENLVNEAALFSARDNAKEVSMRNLERAKDKILMGVERRSLVMNEQEKKNTAYHEAGHAIVGLLMPSHDPVYKVTIIPRSRALGVTMFLPEGDSYSYTKQKLESKLAVFYGGRIAEEMIFGKDQVTIGASDDIKRATEIARNMVAKWGLSSKVGPLAYEEDDDQVFLGHAMGSKKKNEVANETAQVIDHEVRLLIDTCYARAEKILKENIDKLHKMSEALLEYETIDADQIADIMAGRKVREPKDYQPTQNKDNSDDPKIVVDGSREQANEC